MVDMAGHCGSNSREQCGEEGNIGESEPADLAGFHLGLAQQEEQQNTESGRYERKTD